MPAHRPLIVCSSPARRLLIARSSSAHRPLVICLSFAHRPLVVCSSPARHLLITRSSSAQRPLIICLSPAHHLLTAHRLLTATHRPVHATNYRLLIRFPPDILTTESAGHRIGAHCALAGPFAAFQKVILSCLQSHHNLMVIHVASWPIMPFSTL